MSLQHAVYCLRQAALIHLERLWAENVFTVIDLSVDSLRYYDLGANWTRRVEHVGAKPAADLDGPLIV